MSAEADRTLGLEYAKHGAVRVITEAERGGNEFDRALRLARWRNHLSLSVSPHEHEGILTAGIAAKRRMLARFRDIDARKRRAQESKVIVKERPRLTLQKYTSRG